MAGPTARIVVQAVMLTVNIVSKAFMQAYERAQAGELGGVLLVTVQGRRRWRNEVSTHGRVSRWHGDAG